jgi:hypothetical protein
MFLDRGVGGVLEVAGDREGGEHHGQVGLDRLPLVVEDRPRTQVGLGHPEGLLDLPEVVIGLDDRRPVPRRDGQVGDVGW